MAQKEVNYLCIAQQFTYRGDYETHLTKDLGLRPGAPAWESAIRAFELKEHLDAARRRRDRAPKDLSEERQLIEIAEKRTLQVARASRTPAEFSRFLREELGLELGSRKFEAALRAWAVFRRETL